MVSENQREDMRNFLVKAYADGVLDDSGLESRLSRMENADSPDVLVAMVDDVRGLYPLQPSGAAPAPTLNDVPAAAPAPGTPPPGVPSAQEDYQLIQGRGISKKYRGRWFTNERIMVELDASSVTLDFCELASYPGTRLEILLSLSMSTLKLIFPRGTAIAESVDSEFATVRVRQRGVNALDLEVSLRGSARMSTVKVKAR